MNPSGFFEVLRDRWIVVGISTVLGLLAGVLLTLLTPTTFKSSTELFLTTPGWGTPTTLGNADSSPFQGDEFSQHRPPLRRRPGREREPTEPAGRRRHSRPRAG
ncbi:hypothetical protein ABT116_48075, partial [Streptomyces sp. NPDC002130]|uniref:hypothetical protein n=1 Tax=Streptomyces sp. NPDC002130 TaxID=3155568 RepID=UPI0033242BA5